MNEDLVIPIAKAIYGRGDKVWERNRQTIGVANAIAAARRVLQIVDETGWALSVGETPAQKFDRTLRNSL